MLNNNQYINALLACFFVLMIGFVLFANKMFNDYHTEQLKLEEQTQSTGFVE